MTALIMFTCLWVIWSCRAWKFLCGCCSYWTEVTLRTTVWIYGTTSTVWTCKISIRSTSPASQQISFQTVYFIHCFILLSVLHVNGEMNRDNTKSVCLVWTRTLRDIYSIQTLSMFVRWIFNNEQLSCTNRYGNMCPNIVNEICTQCTLSTYLPYNPDN